MTMKLVAKCVSAMLVLGASQGIVAAQTDRKQYPGALCHEVNTTQSQVWRTGWGSAENHSTSSVTWICPIVRDDDTGRVQLTLGLRYIFPVDSHCELVSTDISGTYVSFQKKRLAGGGQFVRRNASFALVAPNAPNNGIGQDFLKCVMPANSAIESYRTYSYE